jgi:hypothetical protein
MRRTSLGVTIAGKNFGSYRGWICPTCSYESFSNSTCLKIVRSARPRGITWDTVEQWYEHHIRGSWFAEMDVILERVQRGQGVHSYEEVVGGPPPPGPYRVLFSTEARDGFKRAPKKIQRLLGTKIEQIVQAQGTGTKAPD